MNFTKSSRKCLSDKYSCCYKQHFMRYMKDSASNWFIINTYLVDETYLIDEKDVETINYNEPQKDLFESESTVKAANKVIDYEAFIRDQEKLLKNSSKKSLKSAQITAKKISQKYKNIKKLIKKNIFSK